jgi:hypothetical protein
MTEKRDPEKIVREIKRKKCAVNSYPPPRDGGERGQGRSF